MRSPPAGAPPRQTHCRSAAAPKTQLPGSPPAPVSGPGWRSSFSAAPGMRRSSAGSTPPPRQPSAHSGTPRRCAGIRRGSVPQHRARPSLQRAARSAVPAARRFLNLALPCFQKASVHFMLGSARSGCIDGREANPAAYTHRIRERAVLKRLFRDRFESSRYFYWQAPPEIVGTSSFLAPTNLPSPEGQETD